MKKFLFPILITIGLAFGLTVLASVFNSAQLAPGPSNGNCLKTNGSINNWANSCGSAASTTPANPTNSVQFNNAGVFGGTSNLLWDSTNTILTVGGNGEIAGDADGIGRGETLSVEGGSSTSGNNNGGTLGLLGGNAIGTGNGGTITITSGMPGGSGGQGGVIQLTATNGIGSNPGGAINLTAGNGGATNGNGGNIVLTPGIKGGNGSNGIFNVAGVSTLATTTLSSTTVISLTDSGLTSGNCVQASTNGLLTTIVGACGAGGGGSGSGWATSTPNYITTTYPTTNGASVGINSSTPIAQLSVVGISGSTTPEFAVASSTNTINLQVTSAGQTLVSKGTTVMPGIGFLNDNTSGFSDFGNSRIGFLQSGVTEWFINDNNGDWTSNAGAAIEGNILGVATPAYTYNRNGDFSTGMYSPAKGQSAFSSAGVQVALFDNLGQFSINSATPTGMLVVEGKSGSTTPVFIVASSTNAVELQIASNGSTTINSLGAGLVRSTSGGSLYTDTNTYTTVGGNPTDVQYNAGGGNLGGSDNFQWINASNLILLNGNNTVIQTSPTSTMVVGNFIQAGGVSTFSTSTNITGTQFICGLGLFYLNSTSSLTTNLKFPDLTQISIGANAGCGGGPITNWASQYGQAVQYNASTSSPVSISASGTGETMLFAPGTGPVSQPGQSEFAVGGFVASSTISGATTTGMSFNFQINSFQPRATNPTMQGQFVMASSTATGGNPEWTIGNLLAGSSALTVTTSTAAQISINCATASGSQNGCLSSGDWTTFNNKQAALTNPDTGTGVSGQATYWSGTTALSGSTSFLWDNTAKALIINSSTPAQANLEVVASTTQTSDIFRVASTTGQAYFSVNGNGQTLVSLGSTAAPGLSFIGDTNTGIKNSGSHQMVFVSNGSGLLELTANIASSGDSLAFFGSSGQGGFFGPGNGDVTHPDFSSWIDRTSGMSLSNNKTLNLVTNSVSRMYFDSGGSVGINSTTPTATLVVQSYSGSTTPIFIVATSTGTGILTISPNSKIGVGTSTASGLFTIQGSSGFTSDLFDIASSTGANILSVAAAPITSLTVGTSTTVQLGTLFAQGNTASTSLPLLTLASSTGTSLVTVGPTGWVIYGGARPALSSCGTGSPSIDGNDRRGVIQTGTTATTCTLTFSNPIPAGSHLDCWATDDITTDQVDVSATSTTAVSFSLNTGLTTGHIFYGCDVFSTTNSN